MGSTLSPYARLGRALTPWWTIESRISLSPTGFQDVLERIRSETMQKLEFHLIFGFGRSKFKEGPQIRMSMFRINLMIIGVPNVDP